jgi:hypothetical protein
LQEIPQLQIADSHVHIGLFVTFQVLMCDVVPAILIGRIWQATALDGELGGARGNVSAPG